MTKTMAKDKGERLRYATTKNHQSLVVAGAPGSGKTTALLAWMYSVLGADSSTQFFVVGRERDRWLELGLSPESVVEIGKKDEDHQRLFCHIRRVSKILFERIQRDRTNLKEGRALDEKNPVWLVLDDWSSISSTLGKLSDNNQKEWQQCLDDIQSIIVLGREQKVGACVATHSLKRGVDGLVDDASTGDCLLILSIDPT